MMFSTYKFQQEENVKICDVIGHDYRINKLAGTKICRKCGKIKRKRFVGGV